MRAFHLGGAKACTLIVPHRIGGQFIPAVELQHLGIEERGAGGDQRRIDFIAQPSGQTDVIGVIVGDDDLFDRLMRQRACQQSFPSLAGVTGFHPGVDDRPTVIAIKQIDIHMIERHRQRQARPKNAGSDFDGLALCGRVGIRKGKTRRDGIGNFLGAGFHKYACPRMISEGCFLWLGAPDRCPGLRKFNLIPPSVQGSAHSEAMIRVLR